MTDPVLWNLDSHTAAKHRVLRSYLGGWIGVMGHQALRVQTFDGREPRLVLIDGFAGPGRYAEGQLGSPLIMLEALVSPAAFSEFGGVQFDLLFIEHDRRRVDRLRDEVAALGVLPPNVSVQIEHGEFETKLGSLINPISNSGKTPTFAFIDPFGYSTASMSLTGRLLNFPRCEVLFFLPLSFVHRFVGREGQDAALTSLFDSDEWREAIPLSGPERSRVLLELFERQLGKSPNIKHVRSFQLRTGDGNDYRLVFGLGHTKGLELAKDAMWRVDPVGGTSYTATTQSGQEILFAKGDLVDTSPLLRELRARFETGWFSIDQAVECTLIDTPFKEGHLRQRTLQPAEREGVLEVERPGARGYKNARLRFLA